MDENLKFIQTAVLIMISAFLNFDALAIDRVRSQALAEKLIQSVRAVRFDQVVDFGPNDGLCPGSSTCTHPAPSISAMPNIDLAVMVLEDGKPPEVAANVLFSRDFPEGKIATLSDDFSVTDIRFRRWNIDRWNGKKGWDQNPPLTQADDIVPTSEDTTPKKSDYMSPYPASTFKLMVAFYLMKLAEQGEIQIADIQSDLDAMITRSDNEATQRLIRWLHRNSKMKPLNEYLKNLGLSTLQINGTDPDRRSWNPGEIHMTAMDTVRLLRLIDGPLLQLLSEQAFHEALSTGGLCGMDGWTPGIPAIFPNRWIDPQAGLITTPERARGRNPSSCNASASVEFLHKTGLTYNYSSDAGIVKDRQNPGKRYIVAWFSNLGYRYADPQWANTEILPCFAPGLQLCVTRKAGDLGNRIHQAIQEALR